METLDCQEYFLDVIELTLSPKGDVRMSAIDILYEQGFLVSDDDVEKAHQKVKAALAGGYDSDWIELIRERLKDFENVEEDEARE